MKKINESVFKKVKEKTKKGIESDIDAIALTPDAIISNLIEKRCKEHPKILKFDEEKQRNVYVRDPQTNEPLVDESKTIYKLYYNLYPIIGNLIGLMLDTSYQGYDPYANYGDSMIVTFSESKKGASLIVKASKGDKSTSYGKVWNKISEVSVPDDLVDFFRNTKKYNEFENPKLIPIYAKLLGGIFMSYGDTVSKKKDYKETPTDLNLNNIKKEYLSKDTNLEDINNKLLSYMNESQNRSKKSVSLLELYKNYKNIFESVFNKVKKTKQSDIENNADDTIFNNVRPVTKLEDFEQDLTDMPDFLNTVEESWYINDTEINDILNTQIRYANGLNDYIKVWYESWKVQGVDELGYFDADITEEEEIEAFGEEPVIDYRLDLNTVRGLQILFKSSNCGNECYINVKNSRGDIIFKEFISNDIIPETINKRYFQAFLDELPNVLNKIDFDPSLTESVFKKIKSPINIEDTVDNIIKPLSVQEINTYCMRYGEEFKNPYGGSTSYCLFFDDNEIETISSVYDGFSGRFQRIDISYISKTRDVNYNNCSEEEKSDIKKLLEDNFGSLNESVFNKVKKVSSKDLEQQVDDMIDLDIDEIYDELVYQSQSYELAGVELTIEDAERVVDYVRNFHLSTEDAIKEVLQGIEQCLQDSSWNEFDEEILGESVFNKVKKTNSDNIEKQVDDSLFDFNKILTDYIIQNGHTDYDDGAGDMEIDLELNPNQISYIKKTVHFDNINSFSSEDGRNMLGYGPYKFRLFIEDNEPSHIGCWMSPSKTELYKVGWSEDDWAENFDLRFDEDFTNQEQMEILQKIGII